MALTAHDTLFNGSCMHCFCIINKQLILRQEIIIHVLGLPNFLYALVSYMFVQLVF
jgi:hypothetical protein